MVKLEKLVEWRDELKEARQLLTDALTTEGDNERTAEALSIISSLYGQMQGRIEHLQEIAKT